MRKMEFLEAESDGTKKRKKKKYQALQLVKTEGWYRLRRTERWCKKKNTEGQNKTGV